MHGLLIDSFLYYYHFDVALINTVTVLFVLHSCSYYGHRFTCYRGYRIQRRLFCTLFGSLIATALHTEWQAQATWHIALKLSVTHSICQGLSRNTPSQGGQGCAVPSMGKRGLSPSCVSTVLSVGNCGTRLQKSSTQKCPAFCLARRVYHNYEHSSDSV